MEMENLENTVMIFVEYAENICKSNEEEDMESFLMETEEIARINDIISHNGDSFEFDWEMDLNHAIETMKSKLEDKDIDYNDCNSVLEREYWASVI